MVRTGSPAKSGVPSGTAKRSPVKRRPASISEEPRRDSLELRQAADVVELFGGEAQVGQIFDRLREAGGQHEVTIVRKLAREQLERSAVLSLAGLEIARRHGELIEVGEQAEGHGPYFFWGCCGGCSFTSPMDVRRPCTAAASS